MAGEEITPSAEVGGESPPERLEQRITAAMDAAESPSEQAPSVDGLPLEPGPAAPATEGGWQGVRDYAKQSGVELPYDTDAAALNDLIRARQQLRERNAFAEVGQRLSPYMAQFQEFLRARQQPQAPPSDLEPPPFDEKWVGMVERDESTGLFRARAGYDPAFADKVNAFVEWRDRFQRNPFAVLRPVMQHETEGIIERKFAEYQQQQQAQQLVARNASWLYQRDAAGNAVFDPATGQPRFTPEGVVYAQEARRVYDAGVRDVRAMDYYARAAAENYALRARFQQSQPAAVPAPAQQAALAAPSVGGGAGRGRTPGTAPPAVSRKGMSLRETLQVALADAPDDLSFGRE